MTEVDDQSPKKERERSLFEAFCATAGIKLSAGTLRQPDPPAADIEVEIVGQGPVRYELVRLNDPRELRANSLFWESDDLIRRCWRGLTNLRQEELRKSLRDAEIAIGFARSDSGRERMSSLESAWRMLASLRPGFVGLVPGPRAEQGVVSLYVNRRIDVTDGPRFRAISWGSPSPANVVVVPGKLQRPYPGSGPIELLAYVERGDTRYVSDEPNIRAIATAHLPASAFRCVWVFEEMPPRAWKIEKPAV